MKLEILISTMNKRNISELNLDKRNIFENCLIINQITDEKIKLENEEIEDKGIRMISYKEKGISSSRNRALENAKGDICLIVDDDLVIKKEYLDNILNSFEKNPEYDVITFQSELPEGGLRKKYSPKEYIHNIYTITKVSSIEIAFRRKNIQKKIIFDIKFGCGSLFPGGEEIIFLNDCYKNKLKLKYVPLLNSCHEAESTGNKINKKNTKELMYYKGVLARRLYGNKCYLVITLIWIKNFIKFPKNGLWSLRYLLKGGKNPEN